MINKELVVDDEAKVEAEFDSILQSTPIHRATQWLLKQFDDLDKDFSRLFMFRMLQQVESLWQNQLENRDAYAKLCFKQAELAQLLKRPIEVYNKYLQEANAFSETETSVEGETKNETIVSLKSLHNEKISDASLIESIKSGDEAALSLIYSRVYPLINRLVLRNGGNPAEAEDILQDVMVIFYQNVLRESLKLETSISKYIYSLAHLLWLKRLRKRNSESKLNKLFENNQDLDGNDPSIILERSETYSAATEIFHQLSDQCRQILTLYYVENLPLTEISIRMGYGTEGNIRSKKYKCLRAFMELANKSPELAINLKKNLRKGK